MMDQIAIIDYGLGNIGSLENTIKLLGFETKIISNFEHSFLNNDLKGFILPGVGAFPTGIKELKKRNLDIFIRKLVDMGIPGMGICLGMQLLAKWSIEGGQKVNGLGYFQGGVVKLDGTKGRVPHIGWTSTESQLNQFPWQKSLNGDFYYVHSFVMSELAEIDIAAKFYHGQKYHISAVYKPKLIGVQFHPEKSAECGHKLIKNYFSFFV